MKKLFEVRLTHFGLSMCLAAWLCLHLFCSLGYSYCPLPLTIMATHDQGYSQSMASLKTSHLQLINSSYKLSVFISFFSLQLLCPHTHTYIQKFWTDIHSLAVFFFCMSRHLSFIRVRDLRRVTSGSGKRDSLGPRPLYET